MRPIYLALLVAASFATECRPVLADEYRGPVVSGKMAFQRSIRTEVYFTAPAARDIVLGADGTYWDPRLRRRVSGIADPSEYQYTPGAVSVFGQICRTKRLIFVGPDGRAASRYESGCF
jgi:hypothetical protein